MVKPTLSIIVPVRDCSRNLDESIFEWLDRAADLSDRFELVIVDDGSTDGTDEVAMELSRRFPQVVFTRNEKPLGHDQAVRRGLLRSRGRQIYVADLPHPSSDRAAMERKPIARGPLTGLNRSRQY